MTYDEFLAEWHNDSPNVLVHTSGSTGAPKPLWVEKQRMRASARMTLRFLGLQPGASALLCLPLDYIAGKMMVVRALVGNLRLTVIPPTGHPLLSSPASGATPQAYDLAAMVPLQVRNSLDTPDELQRLQQIRHLIIGGAAVDADLEATLRTFPHAVWSTYGMTETLSHIAMRRLNGPDASAWYTPLPGVTITLNADDCLVVSAPALCPTPLTTNDRAELLPSPVVAHASQRGSHAEHLPDFPAALRRNSSPFQGEPNPRFPSLQGEGTGVGSVSSPAFRRNSPPFQGNCEEGAIGERSDGGAKPGPGVGSVSSPAAEIAVTDPTPSLAAEAPRFRLLGRKDNVIISGGLKIQAEEVEAALRPHLAAPFLVTRRSDPRLGQAVVLLTEGSAAEAEALCRHLLPKYWQPRHYLTVAHLPQTPNGKPARRAAELLAETNHH